MAWVASTDYDNVISNVSSVLVEGSEVGLKLTVVGGGSTYTPELIDGFWRRADRLPVSEIVLLDNDPDRLELVGGLARRMLARVGWPGRLTLTTSRESALEGADFVLAPTPRGRPGGAVR